ncbi:lysophospholipid acyltransferase family protein [Thermoactinomyces mirandus]|uniref:1-acyl-sn-glycerol-3-phosphate acyltransferase n=1 Tax=Thermoactinomyces mirandus TaxID=2756294 RepID=A0A7W1XTH7_9BACL|nr:lysophospholipid acyltransferase family protein [Thermoactinomyces mirandus]MBA4602876.1 1-acyl-sn-glycerol-3-phosphate acyltransferase [Thermoactinomyces mirandus]
MLYTLLKQLVRMFLKGYHRIQVSGKDLVPTEKAFILVGNHVSYLDPFYISAMLERRIHFMAKAEAFRPLLFRLFLRFAEAFPVSRGKTDLNSIRTAMSYLKQGEAVGIFPEGKIKGDNSFEELKQGAAYLAVRARCPIIPVFIDGTEKALPSGSFWIRPVPVSIRIGRPIFPSEKGKSKENQSDLSRRIQQALLALKEQAQLKKLVEF